MKQDVVLGKKSLRFFYFRYKDSPYYSLAIISVTVLVCLLLLTQLILPQMSRWFSLREEVITVRGNVANIRDNINYLNNIDRVLLDKQLQNAALAVPSEKDFGHVMGAISASALNSGVALEDYAFQVGSLSSSSGKLTEVVPNKLVSMAITVSLRGDLGRIQKFLTELQTKLPLSQVVSLNGSGESVSLDIQFYYKKFPDIFYRDEQKLVPISDNERDLLNSLSSWQVPQNTFETGSNTSNIPLF